MAATVATQNLSAEMNYGLQAGGSMSYLSGIGDMQFDKADGDEKVSSGSRFFFTGGAFFNYAFTEYLGMGIEGNYIGVGGAAKKKEKDDSKGGSNTDKNKKKDKYSVKTNNIVTPVTIQYYPMGHNPEDGIVTLYVGGQPNFAFGMNVEYKEEKDSKFEDKFKKGFSFDALAGIKYQLPMGLLFDIRYTLGFMSVFNDEDDTKKYMEDKERNLMTKKKEGDKGKPEPLSVKNRYLSVTVGYSLASLMS